MTSRPNVVSSCDRRTFIAVGLKSLGVVSLAARGAPLVLLEACGGSHQSNSSLSSVVFQLGWVFNAGAAGTYIADDQGYFAEEGLRVKLLPGGPSVVTPPIVASGRALVAIADPVVTAQARAAGAHLRIIGALFQKNPLGIVSLSTGAIKAPAELKGKRIGVQVTNDLAWRAFLELNGIASSDVTTVPVQFDPSPLVSGDVDGYMGFATNELVALRQLGHDPVMMLLSDYGYHLYQNVYITTEESLAQRKDDLVSFLRGEIRGWQKNRENPSLGTQLTVDKYGKDLGLDRATQDAVNRAGIALMISGATSSHGLLWMSDPDISQNLATLKALGVGTGADLFSTDILQAASA